MDLKENLETIFSRLENMFKAKTVIGEPIVIGNVTLIPVVNVTFGIGAGGGEGRDAQDQGGGGLGAGTGARLTPSAIIVVKGDQVSLLPIAGRSGLESIIEKFPEVIDKLKQSIVEDNSADEDTETSNNSGKGSSSEVMDYEDSDI